MGGFANFGGYDDGATSDGYGSGLFDSTVDYSGAEYIDDGASGTVDPGSPIQLDYTDGETDAGIYDQSIWGSDFAQSYSVNLAGNSETAPWPEASYNISDNGTGTATRDPSGVSHPLNLPAINSLLNAVGKFGTGIASM